MSKGNTFENDLLKFIFQAVPIANIADIAASGPLTNLFVSLHTDDVGEAGNQTTNEVAYTGYTRTTVSRTVAGWSISNNACENAAAITFPECGASGAVATHFGVGCSLSGAGRVLYKGTLSAALTISSAITPNFAAGALDVTED